MRYSKNYFSNKAKEIKAQQTNNGEQLDSIKALIDELGNAPSLSKLKVFLSALKELLPNVEQGR